MQRLHLRVLRLLILATVGTVLLIDRPAQGYHDTTTHPDLVKRSIDLAIRTDPRYQELDWYRKEIIEGDEGEDVGCRSTNHFFDPQTKLGLPANWYTKAWMDWIQGHIMSRQSFCGPPKGTRYMNALDWARDGMPSGDEKLDWHGAIEAYDYSGKLRAYEALGHVLHLLQDLGQPDHARNRPHPCNLITVPPTFVGSYEALWQTLSSPPSSSPSAPPKAQWRKGSTPQTFKTLDEAFIGLAKISQSTEHNADRFDGTRQKGLPFPDELALGCRADKGINDLNAWVVIQEIQLAPSSFMRKAKDSLWLKYELNIPAVRTIPPNPSDSRYQAYLALGNTLLPIVEEYGAGLLMLFYDIVNFPPYVEEVEIYQKGQRKYRKTWKDEISGNPPRVTRRRAEVEGGELEAGVDAELTIRIGPKDEDPKQRGTFIRRGLKSLKVTVVPEGEKPEQGILVDVHDGGDEKSPKGGVWKGHFTPSRSATLRIEATDVNKHFKDEGGQREQSLTPVEGKSGTQGDLDADPSTPARAAWQAPAGDPYPWAGYEAGPDTNKSPAAGPGANRKGYAAGPDTNHKFTVASEACGSLTPKQMDEMRWGTWAGTIDERVTNPNLSLETRLSVSFRAAFEAVADPTGTVKDRFSSNIFGQMTPVSLLSKPPITRFGRVRGSGTWEVPEWDYNGHYYKAVKFSAYSTHGNGYLDLTDPRKPHAYLSLSAFAKATEGGALPAGGGKLLTLEEGEVCGNTWNGKTHKPYGSATEEISWNFEFRPSAPPPHMTRHMSVLKLRAAEEQGRAVLNKLQEAEVERSARAALSRGDRNTTQRIIDASVQGVKMCILPDFRGYEQTLFRLIRLWLPDYGRYCGGEDIKDPLIYDCARKVQVGEPDPQVSDAELDAALDQAYTQELDRLDAIIAQRAQEMPSYAAGCAAATEALAKIASPNAPSPVLLEVAQKIRQNGIEALAGMWGSLPKP
ncbi:MAG TPA: hypothetical protein VHM88_07635, partial [Candidatus Acidoferrales bacterium]|nr:hypothetical protein [Candidatus Acidoferrales bacterium]